MADIRQFDSRCLQEVKLEGISDKLMCQICSIEFSDISCLDEHISHAHPLSQQSLSISRAKYNCHLCSAFFQTEIAKFSHLQSKHSITKECNVVLESKPDISQNCQFCGRFFRHASVLSMHIISCKKLVKKFDGGDIYCDYVTLDESVEFAEVNVSCFSRHKRCVAKRGSHTSGSTLNRDQLRSQHSKKSPHSCKYCERVFRRKMDADAHMRCSHRSEWSSESSVRNNRLDKSNSDRRVSCAYCIKSFTRIYDAIAHVRKVHPNKIEEFITWLQRRKTYLKEKICSVCAKTFNSSQEATEHFQNFHKEEENKGSWACELCSVQCNDEVELIVHIADHIAADEGIEAFHGMKTHKFYSVSDDNITNIFQGVETCTTGTESNLVGSYCANETEPPRVVRIIDSEGVANPSEMGGNYSFDTVNSSQLPLLIDHSVTPHIALVTEICEKRDETFSMETTSTLFHEIAYMDSDTMIKSEHFNIALSQPSELESNMSPTLVGLNSQIFSTDSCSLKEPSNSVAYNNVQVNSDNLSIYSPLKIKGLTAYKCLICFRLILSRKYCFVHADHHQRVFKNFCHVCWKYSSSHFESVKHIINSHKNRKFYYCFKCKASLLCRTSKNRHTSQCSKVFICYLCSKQFRMRKAFVSHKLSHICYGNII